MHFTDPRKGRLFMRRFTEVSRYIVTRPDWRAKNHLFSAFALVSVSLAAAPLLPGTLVPEALEAPAPEVPAPSPADLALARAAASCRLQNEAPRLLLPEAGLVEADARRQEREDPCQAAVREPLEAKQISPDEPSDLETTINGLVGDAPIRAMGPAISRYDADIAGLIVGIAKKESDWGRHVPRKGGDCFNYWGYTGSGSRGKSGSYGCFATPEEGVQAIGTRLEELVSKRRGSDPRQMVVWKCGASCKNHSKESVNKWVSDVRLYYQQIAKP
jgi:hypothetical protein